MSDIYLDFFPLDNAGSVFPGQNSNRWSNVFRLSVKLDREIIPEILRDALENTLKRIPTLKVRMRNGFFRNYYEENKEPCPISHDVKNFCYRINFRENNGYLLRIYYHRKRISVDFYHALCDGHGGTVFLLTLAGEYLRAEGLSIKTNRFVLDTNDRISKQEAEDAYLRYCAKDSSANLTDPRAYHKKGTALPPHMSGYTAVTMSFDSFHKLSKSLGVTVTELLAAIMLDIHYRKQLQSGKIRKPVSVQIPVNLRKFFPSDTLRNFVLCVTVRIDGRKKEYTFPEILESVSSQLRHINNEKAHSAYITRTVKIGAQAIRAVPLVIKNLIIKIGFLFGAEYSTSVLISNLGSVELPEGMKDHVENLSFYTGPGLVNGARCGVACIGDSLTFTFSNRYKEDDTERDFLTRLSQMGITTLVATNRDTDFSDIKGVTPGDKNAYSDEAFIPSKKNQTKLKKYDMSLKERLRRYFYF